MKGVKTMQMELTELIAILKSQPIQTHSFEIGKKYLIRTATHYELGKLIKITDTDLVLGEASWIPDTGRFSQALKTGSLDEIEPFINPVIINRGGIIDATIWDNDLPKDAK